MTENEIGRVVVDAAYKVHVALGPGLLESVYEVALAHELKQRGLKVERQVSVPIVYDGLRFEEGFRADLVVDDRVIVEVKSLEDVHPVHKQQVLTHLRLRQNSLGYLINFGAALIKDGLFRIVNGAEDWRSLAEADKKDI